MLRDHRAHEQTAIAPALDRQFFGPGVLLFNQILGGGREIIEHSLLPGEIASLVPFLTELAAAANICHDIDAAAIEPKSACEIEIRRHAHAVSTVAVEQRRIIAV